MAEKSNIQWTDATWNIARGCTKVDEDCKFCYMYRDSLNGTRYEPKKVTRTKTVFDLPLRIKQPSKIFTSSLTDFFHEDCDAFRGEAWEIIRKCPQHTFQILTKRPDRIINNLPIFWDDIRANCWLGTSIGAGASIQRLFELIIPIQSGIKFLSLEPLHGPIDLHLDNFIDMGSKVCDLIDWVIVGGESGNENGQYRYRECKVEWIESIVYQCRVAGIPVFVKQLGTNLSNKLNLSDRHGGNIDEWPEHLRIREFPKR
jgi:protein gp37